MKVDIALSHVHRLLAPRIAYLVTSVAEDGKANVAPFSNLTSISTDPQVVALAILPGGRTLRNIQQTREFVVNVADRRLLDEVWISGDNYAGNPIPEGVSKARLAGLTETPGRAVRAPRIVECYAHLECELMAQWEHLGNHVVLIGRVVAGSYDESVLRDDRLDLRVARPLMQVSGAFFTSAADEEQVDQQRLRDLVRHRLDAVMSS